MHYWASLIFIIVGVAIAVLLPYGGTVAVICLLAAIAHAILHLTENIKENK